RHDPRAVVANCSVAQLKLPGDLLARVARRDQRQDLDFAAAQKLGRAVDAPPRLKVEQGIDDWLPLVTPTKREHRPNELGAGTLLQNVTIRSRLERGEDARLIAASAQYQKPHRG